MRLFIAAVLWRQRHNGRKSIRGAAGPLHIIFFALWPNSKFLLRCVAVFDLEQVVLEEIDLAEPKYRLPAWIQTLWVIVLAPIFVLALIPSLSKLVLGPIAILAIAALLTVTAAYNKTKTGMWLPGAKKDR
ncbi:hypothetical protein [Bradyrhizobium sp. UFLA03-84]|uniref:hypothetical protein n=1 Tax=Bradyrhizobium sp. UFLA03-84 TaxID=418599 RepID=UPI001177FE38|nr:hypothetical protein [Bradyrhizobium sp. UFLA03-84]